MKRADVVTVATGGGFGGKPRPALIVQSDEYVTSETVIVALFTTAVQNVPTTRPLFQPTPENGLLHPSELEADVIVTARRSKVGRVLGSLSRREMARVDAVLAAVLGLAG